MQILHYSTKSGREPVKEFIESLPVDTRFEILALLRRMESGETLSMPHSRSLATIAHGLYELRVRDVNGQIRVFYYTKFKNYLFLLHALRKKSRTISAHERELIVKRIRQITQRY
jgi:phage-related protein